MKENRQFHALKSGVSVQVTYLLVLNMSRIAATSSELELNTGEYLSPFPAPSNCIQRYFSSGSIAGSIFTTLACTVGIGILSLPYAVNITGVGVGVVFLMVGMIASFYTCNLLVQCAVLVGKRTYEDIGYVAYGRHMHTFVAVNMICNNYGTLVAYMVLMNELIPNALRLMGVTNEIALSGLLWSGSISLLVVLPLSLARKVSAFRFSSVLSFFSSLFIAAVIVISAFTYSHSSFLTRVSHASYAKVGLYNFTLSIPLVVFAYTCQQNILYIYQVRSR